MAAAGGHNALAGHLIDVDGAAPGFDCSRIRFPVDLNALNVVWGFDQALIAQIAQYQSLWGATEGHERDKLTLIQINRQRALTRYMDGFMTSGLINDLDLMDKGYRSIGHRNSGIYCHTHVP